MALSSGIAKVFIFTSLLFISGYILQQQTVRGLQDVIRPRQPTPTPIPKIEAQEVVGVPFGDAAGFLPASVVSGVSRTSGGVNVEDADADDYIGVGWVKVDRVSSQGGRGEERLPLEDEELDASAQTRMKNDHKPRDTVVQERSRRVVTYEDGQRQRATRKTPPERRGGMQAL
ncbi:MAG: hypothetical protein M1828_004171 [Chrysothrix sp. TS-e1954]|nr:MAG: hypothetical protein M1828_004171 [Chrysothrix sp. TS-e1954]